MRIEIILLFSLSNTKVQMAEFFINLFLFILAAGVAGYVMSFFVVRAIKRNLNRPKLYIKNIKITPAKGEMLESRFTWAGLIINADICNDSDHWAYNLRIHDIYAELHPDAKPELLDAIPLRLHTDLPTLDSAAHFQKNTQLLNLKPNTKSNTTIRILSKEEISLGEYQQLIRELKMVLVKIHLDYTNASGNRFGSYFWLDFKHARFINRFSRAFPAPKTRGRRLSSKPRSKTPIGIKS